MYEPLGASNLGVSDSTIIAFVYAVDRSTKPFMLGLALPVAAG